MKKKSILALVLVGVVAFTGCGNKEGIDSMSKGKLREFAHAQTKVIESNDSRISELEEILKGQSTEEGPTAAISEVNDGTGRLTFNSLDGKIEFPKDFIYPGSSQASNTSKVSITSNLSIVPTSSWSMKMSGTSLEMEHTSGISGTIKAGAISDLVYMDNFQEEVMSPLFEGYPASSIVYSKLFLNDQTWGMEAKTASTIDSEPAFMRAGIVGLGDTSFSYVFVYRGEQNENKDEAILSLLRTIEMMGQKLSVE